MVVSEKRGVTADGHCIRVGRSHRHRGTALRPGLAGALCQPAATAGTAVKPRTEAGRRALGDHPVQESEWDAKNCICGAQGGPTLDAAINRICAVLDNDEGGAELYEAALDLYRARLGVAPEDGDE